MKQIISFPMMNEKHKFWGIMVLMVIAFILLSFHPDQKLLYGLWLIVFFVLTCMPTKYKTNRKNSHG